MIVIDGSQGEGGGQVLRSSLSLSILTGRPFRIEKIRAGRKNPGLMAQHLACVDAATAVSRAEVTGASPGSQTITFAPGEIRPGRYSFEIPTAGSACLVLQTIFYPLSMAGGASTVSIQGGTHVNWSPCYHYLALNWLPALEQAGFQAHLELLQAGFYPQGGGRIQASIHPAKSLAPLDLQQRGKLRRIRGLTMVANLPLSIADRQRRQALRRLEELRRDPNYPELAALPAPRLQTLQLPARFKGTCLLLVAEFDGSRACFFGLGALGKPAERVADEALDPLLEFLSGPAALDRYLADQLLLPLSLANGRSSLTTQEITGHLLTNAKIVEAFLPARIQIEAWTGRTGRITIDPAP